MAKWLVIIGILLVAAGLARPRLSRTGLGHLPGDIRIEGKGFEFFFPLASGIIVSLLLSLLLWLFRR